MSQGKEMSGFDYSPHHRQLGQRGRIMNNLEKRTESRGIRYLQSEDLNTLLR